jgi:peptidoglycan/xylan/chitin deacetylase (PgdA/CDA1 family)
MSVPVLLCYHAISSSWRAPLAVTLERFAAQLERFADRGYVGLTFAESERRRRAGTLPHRTLVVTFDDAYVSTAAAAPVLRELGYPATIFVVGDFVSGDKLLQWPGIEHWAATTHGEELRPLGVDALRSLQEEGWEIASHTMTHPSLPELATDECLRELSESRETISDYFGACATIAYPYGHVDERVAGLAARVGYTAGCYVSYAHAVDEPLRRPRVAASGTDGRIREWTKMAPMPILMRRSPLAPLIARL